MLGAGTVGLLSVPVLSKLTPRQIEKIEEREVEANSREHLQAVLDFFGNEDKIKNCTILLTYRDETYKGPKVKEFELKENPVQLTLTAEPHEVDGEFTYDGIRVVTFNGVLLPPAKFVTDVSLMEGDTLHVTWTTTV